MGCFLMWQAGKIAPEEYIMATALSEIMKQAEKLSADEQLELAAKLIEINRIDQDDQGEEDTEGLDVFSLRHMPPEDSFVVQMRFMDAGEGEPARFDFSGVFDDEEEGQMEAE
jgi:hypothetical protein